MLDELGEAMDRSGQRLTSTTPQVILVPNKAQTTGMCAM